MTTVTAPAPWITSSQQCTLETCPMSYAHITYLPNLGGNAFYIALFALFIPVQCYLGIRHRTWGYLFGTICGLILEVLGYIARIYMRHNPFIDRWFIMYLVCLTIAPAFLSGAIYVSLARIVGAYSAQISRIKQRSYSLIFISFDIISLLLQAAGGAITTSNSASTVQDGINIMIAGLASQVASLTLYIVIVLDFAYRVFSLSARNPSASNNTTFRLANTTKRESDSQDLVVSDTGLITLNPEFAALRASNRWKAFLFCQGLAVVCIYIRSCFRVAELCGGFSSHLANDQTTFMVLEGMMISIAVIAMSTWGHPGIGFNGRWEALNYPMFRVGRKKGESQAEA
ncbi:RTA1-domain-containing protein [Aspergillus sclerotioniger CBS 115572]|uniref:RTA1-domain-containing protein n=1 Tax=Aspergillus sclerotioniger CBS 115572 TaxID=1450535 RepID=A0A317WR21_9EURO|nr:RTA1-domain-containing protein [Aspergillus sclerotioniger CBS 115572]PWY86610.1 RTA1-domain-containing protein [Aspergillus sclerotioniger CBS 115572]